MNEFSSRFACTGHYFHTFTRFCKFKISNTLRRKERRRRAIARRQWYLHKTGKICLNSASLIRVRNIFTKHHSRDSNFLSRIRSEIHKMTSEEIYPWVCVCGRLNKKTAMTCVICWQPWTCGTKHDVTPKQKSYGGNAQ